VNIKLPDVSPQPYTHLAHEGFQFAREQNCPNEYNQAVFRGFFQQGRDIGNIDVLTDIARTVGLEPDAFKRALENRSYRETHQQELQYADQNNVRAVPTFLLNGNRLRGLVSKSELNQAIDRAKSTESTN